MSAVATNGYHSLLGVSTEPIFGRDIFWKKDEISGLLQTLQGYCRRSTNERIIGLDNF